MAKIKLSMQELKHQRGALKRYQRYLPTLVLKKVQLQIEVNRAKATLEQRLQEETERTEVLQSWIAVLGEDAGIGEILRVEKVAVRQSNVAGVEVPLFEGVHFREARYDLYTTPYWVDRALEVLRPLLTLRAEIMILGEQIEALDRELRMTIQRVNLFEKVKIPEAQDNMRVIQVFLGDQQTAAVARGKIAKRKASMTIWRRFKERRGSGWRS
jgi:V/A-type H+-transporting ATPase subunit D